MREVTPKSLKLWNEPHDFFKQLDKTSFHKMETVTQNVIFHDKLTLK